MELGRVASNGAGSGWKKLNIGRTFSTGCYYQPVLKSSLQYRLVITTGTKGSAYICFFHPEPAPFEATRPNSIFLLSQALVHPIFLQHLSRLVAPYTRVSNFFIFSSGISSLAHFLASLASLIFVVLAKCLMKCLSQGFHLFYMHFELKLKYNL